MLARVVPAICVLMATATVAQSKRWFAPEVNCWITQQKVPASWEDAQQFCERHGTILASPLNTQLFNYMQHRITVHNHSVAYFIGTRARRSDDGQKVQYVSIEGKCLDNLSMDVFDAIEQLDLSQGDCLSMDRLGIRAVSCWDQLPYMCYSNKTECGTVLSTTETTTTSMDTTSAATTNTPTTSAPFIPPGYKYESATGSSYKFHSRKASWDDANATCWNEGARLLVVNDALEARVAERYGLSQRNYNDVWAGLRGIPAAEVIDWHTIYGEPLSKVFHEWMQGYPTDYADQTCGGFSAYHKRLFNVHCANLLPFICEISQ